MARAGVRAIFVAFRPVAAAAWVLLYRGGAIERKSARLCGTLQSYAVYKERLEAVWRSAIGRTGGDGIDDADAGGDS